MNLVITTVDDSGHPPFGEEPFLVRCFGVGFVQRCFAFCASWHGSLVGLAIGRVEEDACGGVPVVATQLGVPHRACGASHLDLQRTELHEG